MATALLAAAMLAYGPTPLPTARALYEECRLYVESQVARAAAGDGTEEGLLCELEVSSLITMNGNGSEPHFCIPAEVENSRDSLVQMARAYLSFFDQDPEVRELPEGESLFRLALARKWPCRF